MRPTRLVSLLLVTLAGIMVAGAEAQPGIDEESTEEIRERIQHQLEVVRRTEESLVTALTRLDAGALPEEIFLELRDDPGVRQGMRAHFEEMMDRLREIDPDEAARIRELSRTDRFGAARELLRANRELGLMPNRGPLDGRPPRGARGGNEPREQARPVGGPAGVIERLEQWRQFRPENEADLPAWRQELRKEIAAVFDQEVERTQQQISDLNTRVERLSRRLELRQQNRERLIAAMLRMVESPREPHAAGN
ncbi:MAG: hypothetical protein AAGB51_04360 [Planctomycetota bacterium]